MMLRTPRSTLLPYTTLFRSPLKYPSLTADRDQTVSRRFKPSSRTALIGEQPNPWDLLQPQDAMGRHRGAKPLRRDRKSTRLNSSHLGISYAVFCLKKKKKKQ